WDPAFEAANRVFDRIGALRREKDRAARVRAWAAVDADIRAAKARADGGGLAAARTPKDKGQAIGDVLIGLMMPAAGKVLDAADRTRQAQDNVQTAFALAQYQRATGRFPPTLDALAPDYLPHAPLDLFTGRPLVYRPGPAGYLLYSVGINGTDDGGRGYDSTPQGDDLYVQMPVPERR
ncbi:MAG TPA: hypothetical protein VH092_22925, partial [Urbifossiella sp.]|nr:hypothetical protein [Urbifossiella sp.]